MILKEANSLGDFKITSDNECRRISVIGMGWTGYTLEKNFPQNVFDDIDEDGGATLDDSNARIISNLVVFDDELERIAYYFYNLGRQHGRESSSKEENRNA
jgi:hypothetical protein